MSKSTTRTIIASVSIIAIVAVIIIAGFIPDVNATESANFELRLVGEKEVTIHVGEEYIESGFVATNELGADLTDNVVIVSTVDNQNSGKYVIVYILEDIVKFRTITVVENDIAYLEPEFYHAKAKTTADFAEDITLDYMYVEPENMMPFGLIAPSTASESEKIPLIISLHGQSERGCSTKTFNDKFVVKLMRNWEMQGFNAYVMFPHLTGNFYSDSWNSPRTAEQFFELLDWFIETYNVDTDRIIIQGQSMGGYGCLYMAAYAPEYFAAIVPVSAYNSNADLSKLAGIPIRAYVGSQSAGEDGNSVSFVMGKLKETIGEENINQRDVSHNEIPIVAYTEDLDANNIPDLLEWMFEQKRKE